MPLTRFRAPVSVLAYTFDIRKHTCPPETDETPNAVPLGASKLGDLILAIFMVWLFLSSFISPSLKPCNAPSLAFTLLNIQLQSVPMFPIHHFFPSPDSNFTTSGVVLISSRTWISKLNLTASPNRTGTYAIVKEISMRLHSIPRKLCSFTSNTFNTSSPTAKSLASDAPPVSQFFNNIFGRRQLTGF